MNKQPTTSKSGAPSRFFNATFSAGLLAAIVLSLSGHTSQAGSATWQTNPGSGDWNKATNWMPNTVPNSYPHYPASDTATFAFSNITDVFNNSVISLDGIVFNAGASAFTITNGYFCYIGTGVTNNSGVIQTFVNPEYGSFFFYDDTTAGKLTVYRNDGGGVGFYGYRASADSATFINNGGTSRYKYGGFTSFISTSTAANATIISNGGAVRDAISGGQTSFGDAATAANATLIANGGVDGAPGGRITFTHYSRGETARVEVFGNGSLDIGLFLKRGITVGSIEGDGQVFLGDNALTVGSNNLSTTFSGIIHDGGQSPHTGGSLIKIGTGKLVLSHRNTYTGGTAVNRGRLLVNNIGGSGTGSGPVQVKGGKLGGKGEIAGAVTVGTGTGGGAVLAPGYLHGIGSPGALTIHSPLTFNSDATYEVGMNSSSVMSDEVVALGVTINGGTQFAFIDVGSGSLPAGTAITVINNTAATPIAGTFSNLPDGSTFTTNGNTFRADYQGGDGNDLTLKVQ